MLKSVSNRNFLLACLADCPADNHARQLAQFLYETLCIIMRKIFAIILILSFGEILAQDWSEINSDLGISDTLTHLREIRIYQSVGTTNYTSVFRMYETEPANWIAELYGHWRKVDSVMEMKTEKTSLDSNSEMEFVYLNLFRSHIFDLPSRSDISWKLVERGKIEKVERIRRRNEEPILEWEILSKQSMALDGTGYYFQAKNQQKSNEFEFGNPYFYRNKYPEIDEPKYVCEIIEIIRTEFGIWEE